MEDLLSLLNPDDFLNLNTVLMCVLFGFIGAVVGIIAKKMKIRLVPDIKDFIVEDWGILVPIARGLGCGFLIAFIGEPILKFINFPAELLYGGKMGLAFIAGLFSELFYTALTMSMEAIIQKRESATVDAITKMKEDIMTSIKADLIALELNGKCNCGSLEAKVEDKEKEAEVSEEGMKAAESLQGIMEDITMTPETEVLEVNTEASKEDEEEVPKETVKLEINTEAPKEEEEK